MRAAIITINTARAAGEGTDETGPALAAFAAELGGEIAGTDLIPDDRRRSRNACATGATRNLSTWC